MRMPSDINTWLTRGDALNCFSDRMAQVRYATAFASGDTAYVKYELERIFTRIHRLPVINWINYSSIIKVIDNLKDGPYTLPEDWTPSDFSFEMMDGTFINPNWFEQDNAWNLLLVDVTKYFIFLPQAEKVTCIEKWFDQCNNAISAVNLSFSELVRCSVRARFLSKAAEGSDILSMLIADRLVLLSDMAGRFKNRALKVLDAWSLVLGSSPKILTLEGIRRCEYVLQIDNYLAGITAPRIENLITYLRCLP